MAKAYSPVIDRLFEAKNAADASAFAACFSDDAVVEDEALTHRGPTEIREWAAGNSKKYKLITNVIGVDQRTEIAIVTAHVSGAFPGSPLTFQYDLRVIDDKVTNLKTSVVA